MNSLFLNFKKCGAIRFSLSSNAGDPSSATEGCNISVPSLDLHHDYFGYYGQR